MSIEQKIAELLAESRKSQEIQEEKVKPDGKEGGSNSTTQNAVSGDQSIVRIISSAFTAIEMAVLITTVKEYRQYDRPCQPHHHR